MILLTYNKSGILVKSIQVKEGFVVIIKNDSSGNPYVQIGERGRFELHATLTIMTDSGAVIERYTTNQLVEAKYLRFDRNLPMMTSLKSTDFHREITMVNDQSLNLDLEGQLISMEYAFLFMDLRGKIILADAPTATDTFKIVHGPKEILGLEPAEIRNKGYSDYLIWALSSFNKPDNYTKNYVGMNYIDIGPNITQTINPLDKQKWQTNFWRDKDWVVDQIMDNLKETTKAYHTAEITRVRSRMRSGHVS